MADQSAGESKRHAFIELGDSGLKRWSGYIDEEFVKDLKGTKAHKVYTEMRDNEPVVGAELFAVKNLCRRATVRIEPASEQTEDQEAAEFVEQCLDDMSRTRDDLLMDILSMLEQGWAYFETVYKIRGGDVADPTRRSAFDDGRIGWRKFALRGQDTLQHWELDEAGGVQAMVQRHPATGRAISIPIDRSLLFRPSAHKNNPEGKSILRTAYRPWYAKKQIEFFEAVGHERNLAGMPVFWVPGEYLSSTATTDQTAVVDAFKKAGVALRKDEQMCLVLPQVCDESGNKLIGFELASAAGGQGPDPDVAIRRKAQEIAQCILADLILIGHEATGSYALMSEKMSLFCTALDGWLKSIADVFNLHAIPRLLKLNGYRTKVMPRLVFGPVERVNLKELAEYVTALSGAGAIMFPDEPLEAMLRDAGRLPAAETAAAVAKGRTILAKQEGWMILPGDLKDASDEEVRAIMAVAKRANGQSLAA